MTTGLEAGSLLTPSIRLVRPLGAGAMGSVWVADHLTLHTQVVVKFIGNDAASNPDLVARFTREAAAAAQVKSPHVVQMLDHGITEKKVPYIVMELLEGVELAKYMTDRGVLPLEEVAQIVSQIAKALRRAHERRIVHRDIKPQNIFMCDVGGSEIFVKVLDFGIAKKLEGDITDSGTRTGAMIGTPYYMSPEQLVGAKDIDFRSDLWSLGVVAFQALTGRVPFHGENMASLVLAIHAGQIPVPSHYNPAIPRAIDEWFARACTRDPAQRFQSAQEMGDAFQAAAFPGRQPSAPNVPIAAPPTMRQATLPLQAMQAPPSLGPTPQTHPRGMQSGTGPVVPPAPGVRDSSSWQGFGATTGGTTNGIPKNNDKLIAMIASIVGVVVIACVLVLVFVFKGGRGKGGTGTASSALTSSATVVATNDPPPVPSPIPEPPPAPEPSASTSAGAATTADAGAIAVAPTPVPVQRAPQATQPGVVPLAVPSGNPLPPPAASGSAKPRPSSTPPKKNNDFDRQ